MKMDYRQILRTSILLIFLLLGLFLRVNVPYDTLTGVTVAFYFSRADYLEANGKYLKEDSRTLAPYVYKENYPPLPAYIAVPVYKIVKPFGIDFIKFVAYFPLLIYVVTFFAGFVLVKRLYNHDAGLFFSMLLAVTPVAVKSTIKTYYTEEALGILFILFSIYYLIKSEKFDSNFFLAVLFLTLLSLTWQVFLLVDFIIGIVLLLNLKNKKLLAVYSLSILLPLIIGHIASVYIIGLDYSPIYMIKESLITVKEGNEDYFKIAFDRNDLQTPGIKHFFNEFSYFPSFLILAGFVHLLFNFKEAKSKVLVISGVIACIVFFQSLKFRYFAVAPLIIVGAVGAHSLLNLISIKKSQKITLVSVVVFISLIFIWNNVSVPMCDVNLELPPYIQPDNYYPLTFTVKNVGSDPLCDNFTGKQHAFGGIHIEVENATILNVSVYPSDTNMSPKYKVPVRGINWFEAKFNCLPAGQNGTVKIWVLPKNEQVKVNYRCWLPKKNCLEEAPIGLRQAYRADWRNEECIERFPKSGKLCDVNVFAGYFEKKDFYCVSKEIS